MRKIYKYSTSICQILLLGSVLLLSGCFKDFKEYYLFTDFVVEFDVSTWESFAPGKMYPVLEPLAKGSGVQQYQINLIGERSSVDREIRYQVYAEGTTAEEGRHFRLADGGVTVLPADESHAFINVEILDFPAEAGVDTLVLQLVDTEGVKVSQNYRYLGVAISLTGPPTDEFSLLDQIGPEFLYNAIHVDPFNLDLSADVKQRIDASAQNLASYADGTRRLQSLNFYFDSDDTLRVAALYYGGGGNSLTASPTAVWNYKIHYDAQGGATFDFVDANGNGNSQKTNFAPILADYLEAYTFDIDWVRNGMASTQAPHKEFWGAFYRTDDPSSYIIGSLESLSPSGGIRPFAQAASVHEMFNDGEGAYYSGLWIDPTDAAQSQAFRDMWQDSYDHIVGLAGRELHSFVMYFNPSFHFQDVRFVTYYYSSAGGRFLGQVRTQFQVNTNGVVQPFSFFYQNGNGGVTRSHHLFDDFLFTHSFTMSRNGDRVRFTSVENPSIYFEGILGNYPLSTSSFWP